jgi:hypothetical protein
VGLACRRGMGGRRNHKEDHWWMHGSVVVCGEASLVGRQIRISSHHPPGITERATAQEFAEFVR